MTIPTKKENPTGLHTKYHIMKTNGEPLDKGFEGFVLRLDVGGDPDHVRACRHALMEYASSINHVLPDLARDIWNRYSPYDQRLEEIWKARETSSNDTE